MKPRLIPLFLLVPLSLSYFRMIGTFNWAQDLYSSSSSSSSSTDDCESIPINPMDVNNSVSCRRFSPMDLEDWRLKDVVAVKALFNAHRMGKNWKLVDQNGQQTFLKILGSWSSAVRVNSTNTNASSLGNGIFHSQGIPIHQHFNCSYWKEMAGWDTDSIKPHFGAENIRVLHELYAYHVDRAMGFDTVPAGKLVSISRDFFAEFLSSHVCMTPMAMRARLKQLQQRYNNGQEIHLLGWVQEAMKIQGPKGKPIGNWNIRGTSCGQKENKSNQRVVLDPRIDANESSSDYYKYLITAKVIRKWDMSPNCFFIEAYDHEDKQNCKQKFNIDSIPFRPVNVDNDRLQRPKTTEMPPAWERPCLVPESLRNQILNTNFTEAFWQSLARGTDLQLLGDTDLQEIRMRLSVSEAIFHQLYEQFKHC